MSRAQRTICFEYQSITAGLRTGLFAKHEMMRDKTWWAPLASWFAWSAVERPCPFEPPIGPPTYVPYVRTELAPLLDPTGLTSTLAGWASLNTQPLMGVL